MRNWIIIIFFIISIVPVGAQQVYFSDATSLALSGSVIGYSGIWNSMRNPGILASLHVASLGINYHNRYLIPELGSQSIFGSLLFHGMWGYAMNYFGTKAFNESSFSISYGNRVFKWLDAGITLHGHRMEIEALTEKVYTITGDIGMIIKPDEAIRIGVHMINPNCSQYAATGEKSLPTEINLGLTYLSENEFYIASQLHWKNYNEVFLSFGAEYGFGKIVKLRAGLQVGLFTSYSYGLALNYGRVDFALGFEQHTCLGMSSAVTMLYKFAANAR